MSDLLPSILTLLIRIGSIVKGQGQLGKIFCDFTLTLSATQFKMSGSDEDETILEEMSVLKQARDESREAYHKELARLDTFKNETDAYFERKREMRGEELKTMKNEVDTQGDKLGGKVEKLHKKEGTWKVLRTRTVFGNRAVRKYRHRKLPKAWEFSETTDSALGRMLRERAEATKKAAKEASKTYKNFGLESYKDRTDDEQTES